MARLLVIPVDGLVPGFAPPEEDFDTEYLLNVGELPIEGLHEAWVEHQLHENGELEEISWMN